MRKRPQQGVSSRKADTVRVKRRRTRSATSGSDQQGPSGSGGQTGDSHPDSTSHDEDGTGQSTANEDLPAQSTTQHQSSSQSNREDVPSITTSTASTTSLMTTSTPKKRTDAASAARAQMFEHSRQQAGLKKVTWANPAAERRSSRPRRGVVKLGGFPVLHVSQGGDEDTQIISAPPSRPTSPDLHIELETNTLLQSNSNARDTSSTGVANSSQQPPHLQ